jgi:enamine deaminase RidA (YjgF/YER057c/UK114 family)
MPVIDRLNKLGIVLPPPPAAVGAYLPWVRTGNLVVTSGQLPWRGATLAWRGRLGAELTVAEGAEAARLAAINAIAQLHHAAGGDLERVRRIVRLEGNVHCVPGFRDHPKVLDAASELFVAVFGERGYHTRTALGICGMPLDSPVQISVWAEFD